MVEAGNAIGIHYPTGEPGETIFYQTSNSPALPGVTNADLFEVLNPSNRDGGWDIGHEITATVSSGLKTASLRVFVECLEGSNLKYK